MGAMVNARSAPEMGSAGGDATKQHSRNQSRTAEEFGDLVIL
jgi:hypothetical protein